jgi:energy-coupling factor transporter transmembrane protein EcfT
MSPDSSTRAKPVYLVALAIAMFVFDQAAVISAFFALQIVIWLTSGLSVIGLWTAIRKLRFFFLIIIVSYAFVGADSDQWFSLHAGSWKISVNLSGIQLALLMCLRVITLVLASTWVRLSSPQGAFVSGLRAIGLP